MASEPNSHSYGGKNAGKERKYFSGGTGTGYFCWEQAATFAGKEF